MWPPHGHRHTTTATRSPPHGHSHPWPGHVPGHVMSHVPGYVSAPLTMGTYQGPLALGHSWRPLALWHPRPLLPFGPRPLLPRDQHPSSTMADGGLRLSAALGPWRPPTYGGPRPLAASDLRRPLAHGAPLATACYQGVVVIRNSRVIEPIVRGGGHSGRGGRDGLGGMSWWCGGMSWKWCGRKAKGHEGLLGVDAPGWPTPQGKAPSWGIAPATSARGPRALLPRISVSFTAAWQYLARGVSVLMPLAGYDRATDARGSGRGRNIGYRLCTLVVP